MASVKSLKDLKEERKTLNDLIRKKEKELHDKAFRKVAENFIKKLSGMEASKAMEHIQSMGLSVEELALVVDLMEKQKEKKKSKQTSSPTAPTNNFERPVNTGNRN